MYFYTNVRFIDGNVTCNAEVIVFYFLILNTYYVFLISDTNNCSSLGTSDNGDKKQFVFTKDINKWYDGKIMGIQNCSRTNWRMRCAELEKEIKRYLWYKEKSGSNITFPHSFMRNHAILLSFFEHERE